MLVLIFWAQAIKTLKKKTKILNLICSSRGNQRREQRLDFICCSCLCWWRCVCMCYSFRILTFSGCGRFMFRYHSDKIYLRNIKYNSNGVLSKNIYGVLLGNTWDISISKEPNTILKSGLHLSFMVGLYVSRKKIVLYMQIRKYIVIICPILSFALGFNLKFRWD